MNQLSETKQTMQSNLNAIMQEPQLINHQMSNSIAHAATVKDSHGPPSYIYAISSIQPNIPSPPAAQPPLIPPLPLQHMPTGTQPTMQHNPPINRYHHPMDFMDQGLGMTQGE